jgi:hypothetical protein
MNNIPHIIDSGASVMEDKIEFSLRVTNENPDGSVNAVVRFNKPAVECILQWGIVKMIEEGVKTYAPISDTRRKPRVNASSPAKRRSGGAAKAKAAVVSKKSTSKRARKTKV